MDNFKKIDPLVSIVIPCHNEAIWLTECIDSLISQTETRIEIIIIDDGSRDQSFEVIKTLEARYGKDKIKNFRFEKNMGEGKSRNKGVEIATGEYILQTDADAIFPKDFVEKSLKFFEENKADSLSLGELRVHPRRKGVLANYWRAKRKATFILRLKGQREEVAGIYFYRKKLWQKIGGYTENIPLSTDFDFCIRAKNSGIKNLWAREVYFFHADPTSWKIFFMRLYNGARFSVPIQKKWGRWLSTKQKIKEVAQFFFTVIFCILGFLGFIVPVYFTFWVSLFFIFGIMPIIFHKETRKIFEISLKEKYWETIILLPLITTTRAIASNFGKIYALFLYSRVEKAVTFDVLDIEKEK